MTTTIEPVRRFVPIAVARPALAAALGIDGGAIFQVLAVEELGLSAAAIGTAFGLGLLSLPLQLWAGRIPIRLARRNLQIFFLLAAAQAVVLAVLVAVGASGTLAMTALVVTVTAEVSISVLFVTAWQPLLATRARPSDRQRINAGWSALGRGLLAGLLVVYSAVGTGGRAAVLVGLALVAVAVAVNLGRLSSNPVGVAPALEPSPARPRQPMPPALRWILVSVVALNLGALPLWLVYLSEVLWPGANLGLVAAVQTAAVILALVTWRTTEADLGRRARVGALLMLAVGVAIVALRPPVADPGSQALVLALTVVSTFGWQYASLALLELAHRVVDRQGSVVRMFTVLDVVDSSSLQGGLFVAGMLIAWSGTVSGVTPFAAFVAAMALIAVFAVARTARLAES